MQRLDALPLERFNETPIEQPQTFEVTLAGESTLDYSQLIAATPAVTSTYDGVADPQLVINAVDAEPWDEAEFYPVGRLNKSHGRNLEVLADSVWIKDPQGNHYRSLCIKGSDLSEPYLFKSATAERDFIVNGLQESLVMERVVRASKMLRESGVDTEYILGLALPRTFPVNEAEHGIEDTTQYQIAPFLEKLATKFASDNKDESRSELEVKFDMIDTFKDCDYLVSYRAMDCPFRLSDIINSAKARNDFKDFIKTNSPEALHDEVDDFEVMLYIADELSPELARNLARMHNVGLVHGFLHTGNITALGSIVDLDSCKGEPLGIGDDPVSEAQCASDVAESISSVSEVVTKYNGKNWLDIDVTDAKMQAKVYNFIRCEFLEAYLKERFGESTNHASFIAELVKEGVKINSKSDAFINARTTEFLADYFAQTQPDVAKIKPLPLKKFRTTKLKDESVFRNLPPKYYSDLLTELSEQTWDMSKDHTKWFGENSALTDNTVHAWVINAALKNFMRPLEGKEQTLPLRYLATASFILGRMQVAEGWKVDSNSTQAKRLAEAYRKTFEYFSKPPKHPKDSFVSQVIRGQLSGLAMQSATIKFSPNSYPTDIIYMTEDISYSDLFDTVGLNDGMPVSNISADILNDIKNDSSRSTIILADYELTNTICHQSLQRNIGGLVIAGVNYGNVNKPSLILKKDIRGEVGLFTLSSNDEDSFTLEEVKQRYDHSMPSSNTYTRLF